MPAATQTAAVGPAAAPPNLRVATFDDYPHIERLEAEHGLLSLAREDWQHIWLDHPLRSRLGDSWPIGWVIEDGGGTIVGAMCNVPSSYTFAGNNLIAGTGRGWVVSEAYRGYALWLMDEYFNQSIDLFINTTVNSMAVDPFTAFGSRRVPLGDWNRAAYWVTHHAGFAATALRIKRLPAPNLLALPLAIGLKLKDVATTRYPKPATGAFDIEFCKDFDDRFDAFWKQLCDQKPNVLLCARDRATLAWHFEAPRRAGQLWIATATRAGLLRAYAIFKRQDHPPSGLIRMRLVDYQCLDELDALPALIDVALNRCVAEKIHTLEHVACDLPKMRAFDADAPYRRQLPAWPYYWKAADAAIESQLLEPDRWDPSAFDGDASL
jgi:hypothetical protein